MEKAVSSFSKIGNETRLETQEREFMKKPSPHRSNQSPSRRKQRGREVPASSQKRQSFPVLNGKNGSTPRCPKCNGFLVVHHTDLSSLLEIRCINCGWQPHLGTRMVGVSKEIRSIRNLTTQMVFQPSLRLSLASDKGSLE